MTPPLRPAQWNRSPIDHVRKVIAVASGKGGVGKSTVSVQLALAATGMGLRTGLLDADIYGPSLPRMLGLSGQPELAEGKMIPLMRHGIACMSIGFLIGDAPAVLRGPMISKTLQQLLRGTRWGNTQAPLDLLLIDLPPGTGDVQLSLAQQAPMTGAVIVTTPQGVAVADAHKALQMFRKVGIPVLGVIENMSTFHDETSGRHLPLFGEGGGERLAEAEGTKLLGSLALYSELAVACDRGEPMLASGHPARVGFRACFEALLTNLNDL